MKKMILEYEIETADDEKSAKRALSADNVYCALWDIRQQIFRPARKHGYSDRSIAALFDEEKHGELIGALESKFYEILTGHEICLDDLS
jgi:hypothetical protein